MPRPLPTFANPKNRFVSTSLEYDDGEAPIVNLEIIEDHSKSILSTNDSPDVGFRWSVNPYRGCQHACSYCVAGDTEVLMADGRTRAIRDVRVGDDIYGTRREGFYRRFTRTKVLAHWSTMKRAYRIELADRTELIASADHRFLTRRGWKHVIGAEHGPMQRPHLNVGGTMLGIGGFAPEMKAPAPTKTPSADYMRGYLCGMIRGDGMIFEGKRTRFFRLALVDLEGLARTRAFLAAFDIPCSENFLFQRATPTRKRVVAMRTCGTARLQRIRELIAWPSSNRQPARDWSRGFLAGIFDAEGSFGGVVRIHNKDLEMLAWTRLCLEQFRFDAVQETPRTQGCAAIRIRGGLAEYSRFFRLVDPAIRRKTDIEGQAVKTLRSEKLQIRSITDLGFDMPMFDITTGTSDFIANGVISHNCYARPSHEYLSLGAGTDFETKIVVKPGAPELLRQAFEKKAWRGELVVFSGVTDCYQPIEREMKITRACLEVCLEYRNPVAIITKSPVVERDIDLLQELTRVASARVSVSAPFWDVDVARAMEPLVTTPERRMKIIETLAKAGIHAGISVSPIVPGLNDDHLGDVIERAAAAGAQYAFYVLLRLPGAVKEVFESALRSKLPLRAEKVLRRLREAHGGKLYDSTFGSRGRGEGVYADTIRMLFENIAKRHGLRHDEMNHYVVPTTFRRPEKKGSQTSFGF